ncbi:hypothetical protein BI312_10820 [Xanthomonas citri pv. citri]|nr:hypothetical protein BI314_04055 [Xanthomonas citri pv. citri]APR15274.1 hypothetical protein BI315_10845 [Xanthomonas citri pv. citri]APR21822.1 hypothetical protein BI316_22225 [Xanthomonas citri pv. citri]APR25950.1 hypothetical protein BJD09_19045 [Xanthomonas citri pv. citri]OLR71661.1 hypothetical protein BI312_10820 [Xanthomonas citri pv. citri]
MARCSLYFELGVSGEHHESRMAHGAPQARWQHRDAGPARGGVRNAPRVRIRSASLLFPHFPGSQP